MENQLTKKEAELIIGERVRAPHRFYLIKRYLRAFGKSPYLILHFLCMLAAGILVISLLISSLGMNNPETVYALGGSHNIVVNWDNNYMTIDGALIEGTPVHEPNWLGFWLFAVITLIVLLFTMFLPKLKKVRDKFDYSKIIKEKDVWELAMEKWRETGELPPVISKTPDMPVPPRERPNG